MRKFLALCFVFVITLVIFSFNATPAYSDELEELSKKINELQSALEASKKATTPLESQATSMKKQLDGIEYQITQIEKDVEAKKAFIVNGYKDLEAQKNIFNQTVREYYIKHSFFSPLLMFLSSADATSVTRMLAYQQKDANQDKSIITNTALKIAELETAKEKLEKEEKQLSSLKAKLAKDKAEIEKVVAGAKTYQSSLSGQIAELSAKQQQILSARSGTFTTSVGDVPLADDPNASVAFNPGFSPAFAAFSFGAYTHRNGMSQYGAKARADSGQSYKEILSKYYPGKEIKENFSEPSSITVNGYGSVDFQQYLYGIAEMPSSWNKEALKAQAVAARSYALAYTNNGQKPICDNQNCQVYIGHSKGGAWEEAVNETRGIVLIEGGNPVSTQYSSTTGGYLNTSGWDTKCNSKECWTGDAWEKIAGSPWFYKSWYTETYSNSSSKCGRSHPWLTQEEMADILNAWIVRKNPSGAETDRIIPTTLNQCPINGVSGNPYSMSELRSRAENSGGAITSINSVGVTYGNNGSTAQINFSTNRGSISMSGSEFKEAFNLRAPGYISIRSPLFNIEKK